MQTGFSFELWLMGDNFSFNRPLAVDDLDYVGGLNRAGILTASMDDGGYSPKVDDLLALHWRAAGAERLRFEQAFFVRQWQRKDGALKIWGYSPTELLGRRIVAYASGSSQASKNMPLDDMMKEIVDENFIAPTLSLRETPDMSVTGMYGLAPSKRQSFARRDVLEALTKLADVSRGEGTRLYFDVLFTGSGFLFETFVGARGMDRRALGGFEPLVLSEQMGNVSDATITHDYSEAYNFVYVGGKGEAAARLISVAADFNEIGASRWALREAFRDARNTDDADLIATANEELALSAPKIGFRGNLISAPGTLYGIDWNLGDLVTASYGAISFDAEISSIRLKMGKDGASVVGSLEAL